MFNDRRIKDTFSYRYVQKRVPFTVKEIADKNEINVWRTEVALRGSFKREATREKAVAAYLAPVIKGKLLYNFVAIAESKEPLFTRIRNAFLNYFLNIKYNK